MLLKTSGPGEAPPEIEKYYQSFLETVGMVPPAFLMYSASPGIQEIHGRLINYYRERSNISTLLAALIRYLTAVVLDLGPCVKFNTSALIANGLTKEQIDGIRVNPASAPIGEKDGWMLAFVIKSVQAPGSDLEGHVVKLRETGWTDTDIFDALHIACTMVGMDRMMKALKYEWNVERGK